MVFLLDFGTGSGGMNRLADILCIRVSLSRVERVARGLKIRNQVLWVARLIHPQSLLKLMTSRLLQFTRFGICSNRQ
jgi:hypothetical protein